MHTTLCISKSFPMNSFIPTSQKGRQSRIIICRQTREAERLNGSPKWRLQKGGVWHQCLTVHLRMSFKTSQISNVNRNNSFSKECLFREMLISAYLGHHLGGGPVTCSLSLPLPGRAGHLPNFWVLPKVPIRSLGLCWELYPSWQGLCTHGLGRRSWVNKHERSA